MKILCIVQARYDSSRFPGKVLADLAGYPILEHVVRRCEASGLPVVVATTDREVDDPIAAWAVTAGVKTFRWGGKVGDVVGRFRWCAEHHQADAIIRITADSPLIMPDGILAVADQLRDGAEFAAVTSGFNQVPDGWEAEACITRYLRELDDADSTSTYEREHVFPGIYSRAIAQGVQIPNTPACKWNEPWFLRQRFSVDCKEDLWWLRKLSMRLSFRPPLPSAYAVYDLLRDNPELRNG